ncbi:MAG: nitric-oxide reductase large subunit [Elusimicrobia bacterium]|nr:nitric-oxide reductase large subunit [Candidatus Obscuribacterium magneticum]
MKKLWWMFIVICVVGFGILGWVGRRIYQEMPPIPDEVVTSKGVVLMTGDDVRAGQHVWQAMGGMDVGSVWGHGGYVAPDWTADWLHREAVFLLDSWARANHKKVYADLPSETQAQLQRRLENVMRENTYDPETRKIVIDSLRADAFEANLAHYSDVFTNGNKAYAIQKGAVKNLAKLYQLASFFFWTSWAASTNRPLKAITYTSNWPYEPLVGNQITGQAVVWTGVSILMLLGGIGVMVWYYVSRPYDGRLDWVPSNDPLLGATLTPSQKATLKYFWVVSGLFLVQILVGVLTAHYGVEGEGFYGIPLARWLPYSVTRTWHLQLGILWIATAWLGSGLFIGPVVSGVELKWQRLGVNVLFGALLFIVVGSLAGQWMSIMHKMEGPATFYFGHQGYEYLELGRVWQAGLFAGLLIWLFLVIRGVRPIFKNPGDQKPLLGLFIMATTAIALFYGAGLMWGRNTHLSIVEYWRWWVVHLWVEGFFEVFATVVIAFLFMRLGLIKGRLAAEASLLSATLYLAGGIIGTLHHMYFSGTPMVALAWGSVFSALEVVPLVLVGFAAWEDIRKSRAAAWVENYKWPIRFFLSVAFWNMVGAGLFGFMINPPIALYYMQGLNTTPVHGHAALFGVYGMLGIGLMLFCLKAMRPDIIWKDGLLKISFWGMNIGLLMMVTLSLLPVGLLQTWASVEHGYWYARSSEFLQTPLLQILRWMRMPGDTVFSLGAVALVAFVFLATLKPGLLKRGSVSSK